MTTTAPLSRTQYGIYADCVNHSGEPCYNIPYKYIIDGSADGERLRRAIETAVNAHPTLFTRLSLNDDGEPVQTIDDSERFALTIEQVEDIEREKATFVRPFDLCNDRLFRIRLLYDDSHYYLLQDIHHIISDGTTRRVLLADIDRAYQGQAVLPEDMTLGEVAIAEEQARQGDAYAADKLWYEQKFDCGDCYSPLLPDLEDDVPTEGLLTRDMQVSPALVEAYCRDHGIYKSTFFTAAYSFLLAKMNNEQEVLFNTIHNGRSDKRLARSVGMFVKTLPVFAKFDNETTVLDFLHAGQEQMTGQRRHEAYAYTDVATDLGLQSATLFAWHGALFDSLLLCGKPMSAQRLNNNTRDTSIYLKAYQRDDHYCIEAEYAANAYSDALVSQYLESYEAVVQGFLANEYLREVDIATPAQRALLDSFNQNDVPYDDTQTIVSLFGRQAKATPDNIAVVYKDKRYTYAEVDEMSDRIAEYVASLGLGTEDVVSVLIPRCQWMAIASLGVLKAGCAYQPLDSTYPKERLNFMMKDASAKLLISLTHEPSPEEEGSGDSASEWSAGLDYIAEANIPVFDLNDFDSLPKVTAPLSTKVATADLFILLYTSGSTGIPKGCQLTHGNIVAFCHWYHRFYGLKPEHNVAAYASYGFDACMMDMYPALTCGATVHIIPEELRLDLMSLNDYFEDNHITHAFMTTQVGFQFASNIENHSLLYLSTGGEKLASITPPTGYAFYNVYGPTECTILTTCCLVDKKRKDIPIGMPLDNMRLYIVDPQGHRLPVGAAGELWVSGPQVSRGYLNRPEKTAEVYAVNPFAEADSQMPDAKSPSCKYARIYRTGDIVRYLPDGNIQFVGRRDGQVKIRGFRIELKEVEAVIRDFPGIKDATVQAFDEAGGGKFIAAYIVGDTTIDIEALSSFILEQKPPYMVPAVTMQIDRIPLNQNQKVNKRALPKPVKSDAVLQTTAEQAPLNILEQELKEITAAIVNNSDFGITTVLGYVGLTSISAIRLAVLVNKRFGVTLDSRTLVKEGTIQSIENEILKAMLTGSAEQHGHDARQQAEPDGTPKSAPLSYAQTGVYFECLKNPASTIYNIPYMLTFPSGTDADRLADAVKRVVEAHPELSVHFAAKGDEVVQIIEGDVAVEVPVSRMTTDELEAYKNEFVQPFNLQKAPLCRFEVVTTEKQVALLMDVHHLIFDGGSADLFIRQLCGALDGSPVESETYTYLDFVADQQKAKDSDAFTASQQFFAQRLQTCEGASEIPADLPKTDQQGFIGEAVCPVDSDTADAISAFCRLQQVTPAHLYLAATAYVVSRYTNNREVYLSTVSSGRSNLKIADTVGMFVNTLALGLTIDDVTVGEFLRHTSTAFDETLRHEDYPFARIAADYGFRPAIAYAYQVGVLSQYEVGGKAVAQELLELNVPKFKINIKIESRGVVVQYDDALYSPAVGQALAESIAVVAERMMAQPEGRVRKLSIVSKSQDEQLAQLRTTATGEAPFRFFHECVSYFAKTQPQQEALVACDASYTYQEMDELTDRIAAGLRQRGVQTADRVALLLPRTSRLILALFGVLKAGAAYIPCDPDYPTDRVKLILEDSEARYIITTADRLTAVPASKAIDVESLVAYAAVSQQPQPQSQPAPSLTPDDLAYLIYTSGSTGRPKGVMLRHEGICNYLYGHPANVFAHAVLTDATRILSVTTISFDAALQDIGMAYFNGKTLILATEEQANNPLELSKLIREQHINMVSGTPSRWQTWLTSAVFCDAIADLAICRAGGEKFSETLLAKMRSVTRARIFNCYGPTEITVASNNAELTHAKIVTVGRPQLNVTEFIVDSDGNELPAGVVGELYIGGRGVARGYNNLDDMTRERFIDYCPDDSQMVKGQSVNGEAVNCKAVNSKSVNGQSVNGEAVNGEAVKGQSVNGKAVNCKCYRVYKSGDYAKWLPDGNVLILGRTDHQIKLRGLRIELGEIENVMLRVAGMKKVVIMIRQIGGKEHLCAYYTADREINPADLKVEISRSLTQYMVPTAYLQLAEMPMTPNGKTDVKALPEPQLAVSSAYTAPANDTERTFCDIFAAILQMERVGATDNFFELGGTSLVVTRIIIEADKAGLHVAYGDVFANPTPRGLARLITGDADTAETSAADDPVAGFDYTAINNLLQRNTLGAFRTGERQPLGNVLLTGATGYLGIHILHELINSDAGNIYCLVRGKTAEKAASRLRTLLYYYFSNSYKELFGQRLHVILGDVTNDLCQVCDDITSATISTVINCAAVVKHFSEGTEIEDVNIGGAQRCVDFCIKTGARLIHVSTASTRGLWTEQIVNSKLSAGMTPDVFTEQRLYMGQYLGNKYIYSKFMAERLILDAVALHGLSAKIMRVGNLAARSTDGEFQANFSTNSFMGRIRVYNMVGCCPHAMRNKSVEFSPINEVARAIVLLATTPKECTVFHPYNIHGQFLGDVLSGLSTVTEGIRFVEQEEFQQAMDEAGRDPQKAKQMAALLAYKDMAHGQKTTDVQRDNDYTTQVLYRLGFSWSPTSWDYVERMLTAIGGFGFFE